MVSLKEEFTRLHNLKSTLFSPFGLSIQNCTLLILQYFLATSTYFEMRYGNWTIHAAREDFIFTVEIKDRILTKPFSL
jgi:hypothetical protein